VFAEARKCGFMHPVNVPIFDPYPALSRVWTIIIFKPVLVSESANLKYLFNYFPLNVAIATGKNRGMKLSRKAGQPA
jgi:hypothetical protein